MNWMCDGLRKNKANWSGGFKFEVSSVKREEPSVWTSHFTLGRGPIAPNKPNAGRHRDGSRSGGRGIGAIVQTKPIGPGGRNPTVPVFHPSNPTPIVPNKPNPGQGLGGASAWQYRG